MNFSSDLGGKRAKIPRKYLGLLQFNEELNPGKDSLRSIRAFGFDMRFSDLSALGAENYQDYINRDPEDSDWFRVGFGAGNGCLGCSTQGLAIHVELLNDNGRTKNQESAYTEQSEELYGLRVLKPAKSVKETVLRYGKPPLDTGYIKRDKNGVIITFIRCINEPYENFYCTQRLILHPELKVSASIRYNGLMLRNWRIYGDLTKSLVDGFILK